MSGCENCIIDSAKCIYYSCYGANGDFCPYEVPQGASASESRICPLCGGVNDNPNKDYCHVCEVKYER